MIDMLITRSSLHAMLIFAGCVCVFAYITTIVFSCSALGKLVDLNSPKKFTLFMLSLAFFIAFIVLYFSEEMYLIGEMFLIVAGLLSVAIWPIGLGLRDSRAKRGRGRPK